MKPLFILFFMLSTSILFAQYDNFESSRYFPIEEGLNLETGSPDTLWVGCNFGKCYLFWENDTLTEEFTYSDANDFISSLGAWGFPKHYLIATHAGDGCPIIYRILHFTDNNKPVLTDYFGNCNEVDQANFDFPVIEFTFKGIEEIGRKPMGFTFHSTKNEVLKKEEKE